MADASWPVEEAIQLLHEGIGFLQGRVQESLHLIEDMFEEREPELSDQTYLTTLRNFSQVMKGEEMEWWPCRGTLIALLRHGTRGGQLADGQLDVVDHDVDVMIGVPSARMWNERRWSIIDKLKAKGWSQCYGRTSVDAPHSSRNWHLAREDLMLCTRRNPDVALDMATYIIEPGHSVFSQRFCDGLSEPACYIPRTVGSLRARQGRLRKSAIHPMGRCRAGRFSVPCPHRPLETLRATMVARNFTRDCVALPDLRERKLRGYVNDQSLQLRDRAKHGRTGYLTVLQLPRCIPYMRTCSLHVIVFAFDEFMLNVLINIG